MHNVWFKKFWNWLCNIDIMIFDLLAPPQGPRGPGPKQWCCCMWHSCKYLTYKIWLNFGFFLTPQPPRYPQVPPLVYDPGGQIKIPSDMFCIFHLWEDIQSLVLKTLKLTLLLNFMIFNDIWTFGPSPGPQGAGLKNVLLCARFMWVTHTPNLVGFRPMVKEEIAWWMDRRTDGWRWLQYPRRFFKKVWG